MYDNWVVNAKQCFADKPLRTQLSISLRALVGVPERYFALVEIHVVPVPEENQMVRTLAIHPSNYLGK